MNQEKTVFAQLMSMIPEYEIDNCVDRYNVNHRVRHFTCRDRFYVMSFAQLTQRDSLRDIENCLKAVSSKLYHCGIKHAVPGNTLAKANELTDWRIYADFARVLIDIARPRYQRDNNFRLDIDNIVYAFDSSTISLCLKLCPWANLDFFRMFNLIHVKRAFFVSRAKDNMQYLVESSNITDNQTGVISDEMIRLTGYKSRQHYPEPFRMVTYEDYATSVVYRFIANNTAFDPLTISELYRERWQVELFYKWIKQHLRRKSFYGTSQNAVFCQIWIALCMFLILAIAKKRWKIDQSLYSFSQICGITPFEKVPLSELFSKSSTIVPIDDVPNLFSNNNF